MVNAIAGTLARCTGGGMKDPDHNDDMEGFLIAMIGYFGGDAGRPNKHPAECKPSGGPVCPKR